MLCSVFEVKKMVIAALDNGLAKRGRYGQTYGSGQYGSGQYGAGQYGSVQYGPLACK